MCITETWLTGEYRDDTPIADLTATLPNYDLHHNPTYWKRRMVVVCVCLRNNFNIHCELKTHDSLNT